MNGMQGVRARGGERRKGNKARTWAGVFWVSFKSFYEFFLQGKEETLSRLLFLFQLSSRGFYGGRLVRFAAFYDDWC